MHFGPYKILAELPGAPDIWRQATEVLSRAKDLPMGRTVISDVMYVNKEAYVSREQETVRPEMHRKYLDVQAVIEGMELVRCYDPGALVLEDEYSPERDICFFAAGAQASQSGILDPGHVAIIPPYEAHASQMHVFKGESLPITKVVVKILASAIMPEWK